jgi:hypothetical protein
MYINLIKFKQTFNYVNRFSDNSFRIFMSYFFNIHATMCGCNKDWSLLPNSLIIFSLNTQMKNLHHRLAPAW